MSEKIVRQRPSLMMQILVLGGLILLVLILLLLKDRNHADMPNNTNAVFPNSSSSLPEGQLERALNAGKPTLAFFHSTTCDQCLTMIETVEQVYPEFHDSVVLVDVDIYDSNNEYLVDQVRLQYIPTLIFYDKYGKKNAHIGVMSAETLHERLAALNGAE